MPVGPSAALAFALSLSIPPSLPAQQDASADTAGIAVDTVAAGETPVPQALQSEDERIRADLQAIFDRVPALGDIGVAVGAGVVTLTGEVPDSEAEARAIQIADGQEGVAYVDASGLAPLATGARIEDVTSRLSEKLRDFILLLPLLAVAAIVVAIFGTLAWWFGRAGMSRFLTVGSPFLGAMIQRLLQFALVIAGLVFALELLDATALVGAVVGTAGLAGLALGFAFKDIAENYLAGIILSLRNPFQKNDLIVVGDQEGKVVRLAGRETILMTPDGNHVQIPNAIVFREPMLNYSRNPLRRFAIDFGVASDTILSDALDAGLAVLQEMGGVVDDPEPQALVWEIGDSTVTVRYTGWVDQREADFLRVRSEAIRLVKVGLEDEGIEMPEPEYRVHLPDAAARERLPPADDGVDAPVGDPDRPRKSEAEGEQRNISVDRTLDEQIEAERRATGEEDLLEASPEGAGAGEAVDSGGGDASRA